MKNIDKEESWNDDMEEDATKDEEDQTDQIEVQKEEATTDSEVKGDGGSSAKVVTPLTLWRQLIVRRICETACVTQQMMPQTQHEYPNYEERSCG
jgi:hypothetical protein